MTINKRKIPRQATSVAAFKYLEIPEEDPLLAFPPYLHKQPRRNSITPDLQRAFVAHLAQTGIVKSAALHIGRSLEALYKLRQQPGAEGFAKAWDEALKWGVLRLEDCAMERAIAQGLSNLRANSMLAWVLQYRSLRLFDMADVVPGNEVYELVRRRVLRDMGLL